MYSIGRALKNICRNMRLSLASVATISACIFLFCLFFAIRANLDLFTENIQTKVGITVFFDEDLSQERIREIGDEIAKRPEVREMTYVSPEEAWESFKADYFEGKEELAEGFAGDNPLSGSASYTIFLNDLSFQDDFLGYLESIKGVRQVNYSSEAGNSVEAIRRAVTVISGVIILILLVVAVFLIGNTIAVSAEFRKNETAIMRLIGATNGMIRRPFVFEGIILGFVGVLIPLTAVYFLYNYAIGYLTANFGLLGDVFTFLPVQSFFLPMAGISMAIGTGMGFFASFFSMIRHLKV